MGMEDLTLGLEEEYQIIDPESRELTSYIQEFLESGRVIFRDQVKPELMQSQIEVGSHVCRNIREIRQEVIRLRSMVAEVADKNGRKIVAAGTHPFSKEELNYIHTMLREGSSADRQLAVYRESGSLQAVIDHLAGETVEGC